MANIADIVRDDIVAFLESNEELLFNERDLQMHLATWLRKSKKSYDDVDVEYYVPWEELGKDTSGEYKYIWKSELRLDIVVKKDGEYCPVELKYKTKKVERKISRFNEELSDEVIIMKNQGAQDLGMYDFWKDVRRIELVKNRFKSVKGGLVLFLTNDHFYKKSSKEKSNHFFFNMTGGEHDTNKHWKREDSRCAQMKAYKSFDVERKYTIHWHDIVIDKEIFYYCIVNI